MPATPRFVSHLMLLLCLAAVIVSAGCASRDRHVYRSTALAPKVVSIIEVQSGEVLWSMEVPPGQQLMLDFDRGPGDETRSSPSIPAKSLKWELWSLEARARYGSQRKGGQILDSASVQLPGSYILINVDIAEPDSSASLR